MESHKKENSIKYSVDPKWPLGRLIRKSGGRMSMQLLAGRDVDEYVGRPPYVLIDLREYKDYAMGHIQGAQNLPYSAFPEYMGRLPLNRIYILYCSYGSVSMLAAREMEKYGYHVLSISGGISAYRGRLFV
jgi:rhodanese-related sulfurtransferase